MNEKLLDALGKHVGLWIIVILILVMVGPTGVKELIDRIIPPPTVAAVDKVSDDLDDWKTRTDAKVELMLDNQRRLIRGVHELNETITELSAWSLRMEQRVYQLERQKASTSPTLPGNLTNPAGTWSSPIRSEGHQGTGPYGSAVD